MKTSNYFRYYNYNYHYHSCLRYQTLLFSSFNRDAPD
jgi:hypothetical protein